MVSYGNDSTNKINYTNNLTVSINEAVNACNVTFLMRCAKNDLELFHDRNMTMYPMHICGVATVAIGRRAA